MTLGSNGLRLNIQTYTENKTIRIMSSDRNRNCPYASRQFKKAPETQISFVGAPFIDERIGTRRKWKLRHGQATRSAIKRRIRGRVHIFLIERAHRKKQNETAAVVSVPMGI